MRTPLRRSLALAGLTAVAVVSGSIAAADGTAVRDITDRALAEAPPATDLAPDTATDMPAQVESRLQVAEGLAPTGAPDLEPTAAPSPRAGAPERAERTAEAPPPPAPTWTWHASWYGPGFHGRTTANGETYDQWAMTAAHKTLPFGTRLQVTNVANGRTVEVRINDRGPFIEGRDLDLSRAAAEALGFAGVATVEVVQL